MTYELTRSRRKTVGIQVKGGKVLVKAPFYAAKAEIDRIVESHRSWIEARLLKDEKERREAMETPKFTAGELKAIVSEAKRRIPERVRYYAEIIGVSYGTVSIRKQKTRWGSCSAKGNLNFNCLLVLMPEEVLDAVVVHELCHRKEMNHSERFYTEVLSVYPEYKRWNRYLKQHGRALLNRLP